MLLVGLVLGRWWRLALVLAIVGWPLLLVANQVVPADGSWAVRDAGTLAGGALLAAANTAVGIAVHQALLALVRSIRRSSNRGPSWGIHGRR